MKKPDHGTTVTRQVEGHEVDIEIRYEKAGYYGSWTCRSLGMLRGGSNSAFPQFEMAVDVNFSNAVSGIREELAKRKKEI